MSSPPPKKRPLKLKQKKPRRPAPTRDSVLESVDTILLTIEAEIERLRGTKLKGVQFLRSVGKNLRILKKDATRVMVVKVEKPRSTTVGFAKPVPISSQLASFTGLDPDELHSRTSVNAIIHKYIADNDLKRPDDRRHIVPDDALSELLDYTEDKGDLTFATLQKFLKPHYIKN